MNYIVFMLYSDGMWKAREFVTAKEAEWWAKRESMYSAVHTYFLEEL